jgi:hypothetical protein
MIYGGVLQVFCFWLRTVCGKGLVPMEFQFGRLDELCFYKLDECIMSRVIQATSAFPFKITSPELSSGDMSKNRIFDLLV